MKRYLIAALLVVTACGGSGEARTTTPGSGGGRGGRGGSGVTPVEITVAVRGRVARTTTLAATIEPSRVVSVNAQISGPLGAVNYREGAMVSQGTVLATISAPELQAQLRSAEASLEFAASTARRSEEMFKQRVITAAEVERDRAALASAQATLDALRVRAGFTSVRAPMAGVITERLVEAGDIVSPNQRLFTIADVRTLITRVQISELDVVALRTGSEVSVTADAFPGERFTGRIRRVFPAADSVSRMVPVEVEIGGPSAARLRPGYTARVTFELAANEDAVLIPARAVVGTAGNQAVMMIEDGKPVRRGVRLGAEVSGRVEVLEGLQVGDTIILTAQGLREGATIRVVEPLAPDAGQRGAPIPARDSANDSTAASPGRSGGGT